MYSPNTNNLYYNDEYMFNASTSGIEIYDVDAESVVKYVIYSGGVSSVWTDSDIAYLGTTNSGIYTLNLDYITSVSGVVDLSGYIILFKDYPNITDSHVKYIHGSGDYLCCVTDVGVDHFNFGSSDAHYRSCATISGAEKCWQTSKGRFYYTKSDSLTTIYTYMCDWDENSVGYVYETTGSGNLFFPGGCDIKDIAVTEGTSIYTTGRGATNNLIFVATTSGIVLIEEKQGDEEDSRYKQYFVEE